MGRADRTGGLLRANGAPQVVNPDGRKVLPDGTVVPADAEEQRIREERIGGGVDGGVRSAITETAESVGGGENRR